MVGEEDVEFHNGDNGLGKSEGQIVPLIHNGNFAQSPHLRLTLADLIDSYHTDPESSFHGLRYHVRENHRGIHDRIARAYGALPLYAIDTRELKQWHRAWAADGKVASGHANMAQLRTIFRHGRLLLPMGPDRMECFRLKTIMSDLKFAQPGPRKATLTADQADQIRMAAHERGWHSIALAQAFQFELTLRQKDVIGEWLPRAEPGDSDFYHHGMKWLRGIQWQEIDADLVLRHTTSKRLKDLTVQLELAPMILDEIERMGGRHAAGPVILNEATMVPYAASEFRRKWRILADVCDIPKSVRSMDSRAGGITEASKARIPSEFTKHLATHSQVSQTERYSRDAEDKIEAVQIGRVAYRNQQRGVAR